MEEKRCCIIHNYYVCPVCKTGYCKPFGEVKTRPIQKCRKCNKTVRMTINGKELKKLLTIYFRKYIIKAVKAIVLNTKSQYNSIRRKSKWQK